jgi:UDP-N-acetylmuramyl pentapeptide synthase
MPCLIELGRASKKVHREIGRKIAQVCDLAIITTKDRFRDIKQGAGEVLSATDSRQPEIQFPEIQFIEKPQEIVKKIKEFCHPGDIVLLEGRMSEFFKKLLFV